MRAAEAVNKAAGQLADAASRLDELTDRHAVALQNEAEAVAALQGTRHAASTAVPPKTASPTPQKECADADAVASDAESLLNDGWADIAKRACPDDALNAVGAREEGLAW